MRSRSRHLRALVLACVVTLVGGVRVAAAAPSAAIRCVQAKNQAAARKLDCLAKEQSKGLLGRPANPAKCSTAFARSFTIAEAAAQGACPTTGDLALVEQRVDDIATAVLVALQANIAASPLEKRCVAVKNLAAAKYGGCTGTMLRQRLGGKRDPGDDFARCPATLVKAFAAAERKGGCLTSGDASTAGRIAAPVGTNLSGVVLSLTDLRGAILPGADLSGAALSLVDLSDAILSEARLVGAQLSMSKLPRAKLDGANLSDSQIFAGNAGGIDLSGADLSGSIVSTILNGAELAGADFSGTTLSGTHAANLPSCPAILPSPWSCVWANANSRYVLVGPGADLQSEDLSGGSFAGLDLTGARLGSKLVGADFTGAALAGASLANASCDGVIFASADLGGADLYAARCRDADFSDADLTATNLFQATLDRSDLGGADLTDAQIGGTCVAWDCSLHAVDLLACPAVLPPSYTCRSGALLGPGVDLSGADLSGADLSGLDLSHADFVTANLSGANLGNTNLTRASFLVASANGVDFTGATLANANLYNAQLLGSTWSSTICPDGTNSASNGTSPQSCCTHTYFGLTPAACSP